MSNDEMRAASRKAVGEMYHAVCPGEGRQMTQDEVDTAHSSFELGWQAALAAKPAGQAEDGWLDISDMQPEKGQPIIAVTHSGNRRIGHWSTEDGNGFATQASNGGHIVYVPIAYWMPLPDLPQQSQEGE